MFRFDRVTFPPSCPRLSRASTSFLPSFSKQDVDGRDKPGHDSGELVRHDLNPSGRTATALGLRPRPAVFLDRDGTLNEDAGYVHRVADFRWLPGSVDAIRRLNDGGYYVFVVTNQSGVARGLYDTAAVDELHGWMNEKLRTAGARIDDMRYCPHHPEASVAAYRIACPCRKPAPGMLLDLMDRWPVIRERSIMIGDRASDAAAGKAAGIASAIVSGGALDNYVKHFLMDARLD